MQLFNKLNGLRAVVFSIFLIVVLVLFSCEVTFHEPLQEYIQAVENGKTLRVSVDGTVISHDSGPVDFSYQKIGIASESRTVTIENIGIIDMSVNAVILDMEGLGGNPYAIDISGISFPFNIKPDESATFTVVFQPSVLDDHEAILTSNIIIASSDKEFSSFKLNLSGTGETGELTVLADSSELDDSSVVYFDVVENPATSDKTFTLRNDGHVDLVISGFEDASSPFSLVSPPSTPLTIVAGATETITARFSPVSSGHFGDSISILSDDVDEASYTINMKAGTKAPLLPGVPLIWLNAEDITAGDTVDSALNASGSDFVASWPNSGSGANATHQSGGGANAADRRLPEYESSVVGLNGNPAVLFVDANGDVNSGSDGDVLRVIGTNTYYDDGTVIVVLRPSHSVVAAKTYMYYSSYSPYLRVYATSFYNHVNVSLSSAYSHIVTPQPNTTYCLTNRFQLWDDESSTLVDSYRFWYNGTEETEGTTKVTTHTSRFYNLHIGNHSASFQTYGFRGYIPEVIIYSEAVDESVLATIHNYLNTKYSIW